jgi:hypothetical protein
MTELYDSLLRGGGVQRPNVVMNDGPLPGRFPSGMQTNGQRIDGVINEAESLLGDGSVRPYAYGSSKHLSTQQAYLNVPHRVMKIVPKVCLPAAFAADGDRLSRVEISHPVDEGDVAFVLKIDAMSELSRSVSYLEKVGVMKNAINLFVNVSAVNYILAGLYRLMVDAPLTSRDMWEHLRISLGLDGFERGDVLGMCTRFVRHCCVPFGVVHGSERQGGLNETTGSPATWPVSFVTTMVIDGNVKNLVNAWNALHINSGSDLAFVMRELNTQTYTLNHYYKGVRTETFQSVVRCPQLVPAVDVDLESDEYSGWHVARSQVYVPVRPSSTLEDVNDDRTRLRGGLIEATFAPCFVSRP